MNEEKYSELKLEIFESAHYGEITESEKDTLLETLDTVYEGVNMRIHKEYKKSLNELKKSVSEIKKLYKKEKYSECKKMAEECIKNLDDFKRAINSIEGGFVATVIGNIIPNLRVLGKFILLCFAPIIGPGIAAIYALIEDYSKTVKDISRGEFTVDSLNAYKNGCIEQINAYKAIFNKFIRICDEQMKNK